MAGRKIFPQSVRLDEIKTVWYRETHARARGFQTCPGFFFVFLCSVFWFQGPLAAPLFHVVVPLTGGESLFFLFFFSLCFWSLACSSAVCRLTMWTLVPRRLAEGRSDTQHKAGCCLRVAAKCAPASCSPAPVGPTTSPPVRNVQSEPDREDASTHDVMEICLRQRKLSPMSHSKHRYHDLKCKNQIKMYSKI